MSTPCGPKDRAGDDGDDQDRWAVYYRDPRRPGSVWRVVGRAGTERDARAKMLEMMNSLVGDWWVADTTLGRDEPDVGQGRRGRTEGV